MIAVEVAAGGSMKQYTFISFTCPAGIRPSYSNRIKRKNRLDGYITINTMYYLGYE